EWVQGWNASRGIGCEAGEGLARNLSALIHKTSRAVGPSQRAQVLHTASFCPAKRVRLRCCRDKQETLSECDPECSNTTWQWDVCKRIGNRIERSSRHLAAISNGISDALISTQRPKIDDPVF